MVVCFSLVRPEFYAALMDCSLFCKIERETTPAICGLCLPQFPLHKSISGLAACSPQICFRKMWSPAPAWSDASAVCVTLESGWSPACSLPRAQTLSTRSPLGGNLDPCSLSALDPDALHPQPLGWKSGPLPCLLCPQQSGGAGQPLCMSLGRRGSTPIPLLWSTKLCGCAALSDSNRKGSHMVDTAAWGGGVQLQVPGDQGGQHLHHQPQQG